MPQQKRLDEEYIFPADQPILTPLRRMTKSIEARLQPLEAQRGEFDAAIDTMRNVALTRINDFLLPAIDKVLTLTTLGFLTADSGSSVLLEEGTTKIFEITAGPQRDLFHPTEFVDITRKTNLDTYALGRVVSYDRETGALQVTFESVTGPTGPFVDWQITDTAGTTAAIRQMFADTQGLYESTLDALAQAEAVASVIGDPDEFLANLNTLVTQAQAAAAAAQTFDPSVYVASSALPGIITQRLQDYITTAALNSILSGYIRTNDLPAFALQSTLASLATRVSNLENQPFANAAQIRSKAANLRVDMAGLMNAAAYVQLTDGPTITLDFNTFQNARVTLTGNPRTLAVAPGTLSPGQTGIIEFAQDATGGRSVIYTANQFAFAGTALTLTAGAGKRDAVMYTGLWDGRCLLTPAKSLVLP